MKDPLMLLKYFWYLMSFASLVSHSLVFDRRLGWNLHMPPTLEYLFPELLANR